MFGFLRRRAPGLQAPLRALDWDGAVLALQLAPEAGAAVALDVDGIHFADVPRTPPGACA